LNEENEVIDPGVLFPLEQSLQKEVIQSPYGKRDEIFFQGSEKYSLDDSVVNNRNFSFEFHGQSEESSDFDTQEHIQHPCESFGGKEDNYYFSKRKQKVLSPLSEDEIDQLLKGHVTAQAKVALQYSHSQEDVSETSSTFKNENLS